MAGKREIELLQIKKKALILESEMQRIECRDACEEIRSSVKRMKEGFFSCNQVNPWVLGGAAVGLGFLVVQRLRSPESLVSRVLSVARMVAPLMPLIKNWFNRQKEACHKHEE